MSQTAARKGAQAAAAARAIEKEASLEKFRAEYDKALKAFESKPGAGTAGDVIAAYNRLRENGSKMKLAQSVVNFGNALRKRR